MTATKPTNRTKSGTWRSGQSGNPNGRPKSSLEARVACRALNDETLAVLVDLMRSSADERVRVQCAIRIRDEANGKPTQSVMVAQQDAHELSTMTDDQLYEIAGVRPS